MLTTFASKTNAYLFWQKKHMIIGIKSKKVDNGRIRTYACEHNAYDVSEEIAGHRLNHSATLSELSDYVKRARYLFYYPYT
jgi:hypothetical protein